MTGIRLGIVGATGAVGETALEILGFKDFKFPIEKVRAFASKASAGKRLSYGTQHLTCEEVSDEALASCDVVLFASESAVSQRYIPKLAEQGIFCVDKSSAFRADPRVALVVPEVNGHRLQDPQFMQFPVVANPNCTATPLVIALHALEKKYGVEEVVVSSYQSVSGAGKPGIEALQQESSQFFQQPDLRGKSSNAFPKAIAFNVMPFVASLDAEGNTDEENKIIAETKKIMGNSNIKVTATSVRVPSFVSHAEAVSVSLKQKASRLDVLRCFQGQTGMAVVDSASPEFKHEELGEFVTPRDAHGEDDVFVSRVREIEVFKNGIAFWLVCDNLRKGAALNAIQIVETCYTLGQLQKLMQRRGRA